MRFRIAAIDDQKCRTGVAANLGFDLACIPDALTLAQPKVGEFLYNARVFHGLLHMDWKAALRVEPALHFGIVRPVGRSRLAYEHIAVAHPEFRFPLGLLKRPEIGYEEILVAESRAKRAFAPLFKRQGSD